MKLSICIPVYNFEVKELVDELNDQIKSSKLAAEIILIDDASLPDYRLRNMPLENQVEHFIFLDKNVGRSVIRNLFLYFAKGDFMLFLDCDGKITDPLFLKNYLNYIKNNPKTKVIYGGRKVAEQPPSSCQMLRWKFAVERENMLKEKRLEVPYLSFQTNNFVVKKTVLEKVNFNPEFQRYGYEDLLFAMDLKEKNTQIDHLDNPIFNNDLETNEDYLYKVEESIDSLSRMMKNKKIKDKISEIKLVKAFHFLQNSGGESWFLKLFELRKEKTKIKLQKGNANLRYLDFYKLGLLVEKMR